MLSTYKFKRHVGGIPAFAEVTINTQEGAPWGIVWSEKSRPLRDEYGADTEPALEHAASACRSHGGVPAAVRIEEIVELYVDTKSDAVAVAAVMAAWKAWG